MKIGIYWSAGGRTENEDSVSVQQAVTKEGVLTMILVADGIGGLSHGEIASGMVSEVMTEWFYQSAVKRIEDGESLRRVARKLSFRLQKMSHSFRSCYRGAAMGTTVSVLLLLGRKYAILQIGDSVIWKIRHKKERRLTNCHRDDQGRLLRAVGTMKYSKPDIRTGRWASKSSFLVCSDGFCDKLLQGELASSFQRAYCDEEFRIERKLKALAVLGEKRGCSDNKSAVLITR